MVTDRRPLHRPAGRSPAPNVRETGGELYPAATPARVLRDILSV
jgi:hypothetical protein